MHDGWTAEAFLQIEVDRTDRTIDLCWYSDQINDNTRRLPSSSPMCFSSPLHLLHTFQKPNWGTYGADCNEVSKNTLPGIIGQSMTHVHSSRLAHDLSNTLPFASILEHPHSAPPISSLRLRSSHTTFRAVSRPSLQIPTKASGKPIPRRFRSGRRLTLLSISICSEDGETGSLWRAAVEVLSWTYL
jgi:hypothetical protein